MRRLLRTVPLILLCGLAVVACSGDDSESSSSSDPAVTEGAGGADESSTTAAGDETLQIVVTNDDGIGAPGIDVLVGALQGLADVEINVVAPAENQSGSSDKTTPGGATYSEGSTASGVEGTAVDGYPADTITVALDELGLEPDLVVSGINSGQNVGPVAAISGTVGAAREAARHGVPALAVSAGLTEPHNFDIGADLAVDWITEHRESLVAGSAPTDYVVSINVPLCTAGTPEELLRVPLAETVPEGANIFASDCTTEEPDPATDVAALLSGHSSITRVPLELATP